jgi:hypothetical protein
MIASRWPWTVAIVLLFGFASNLSAQTASNNPHIGYVYPGGGCRGTTFEVVVGGQFIKEVTEAFISGGGIRAEVVGWYRPMTQGEYVGLNQKIRFKQEELEKKNGPGSVTREQVIKMLGITEEQLKEMKIYEMRRADFKRQPNPQIEEELTVRIQINPDAAVGDRELRLLTKTGMSNPLWFYVGQYPEIREKEPNDITPDPSVYVKLPAVINGQVMPGDVDRFAFEAKKGAKLVAHCAARELIPYLADAVPGWFQAVLHLYDDKGNEVAFADSFGFRHDPVMLFEIPKDGKYVIEVHDSIFRGREDFVYRISIGEIPYITGLFPLGGRVGSASDIEVKGWNLPVNSIRLSPSFDRGRTVHPIVLEKDNIFSNRVAFLLDILPEVVEKEPNDTLETARKLGFPIVVNGHIDRPGDVDFYEFEGSGVIIAEVFARRLYSPLDSVVTMMNTRGEKVLAHNDDYEDKSWPLITHHADSRLLTVAPGKFCISIRDAQGRGGPDYAYRLCVRPPRPDFDLRVTPSSITAQAGTHVPITVHAIRKDGFDGDIALELENPPPGFALTGAWVPGGQDKARLTLLVPPEANREPVTLQINGHATLRGRRISRPAFPADEMTQAFSYQHLMPTKDWTIFVTGNSPGKPPCSFADTWLRVPLGGTVMLRVAVEQGRNPNELRFELSGPPEGITAEDPVALGNGLAIPIKCDIEKVKIGLKGNLLFVLSQEHTYVPKGGKKPTTSRRVIGLLPAIPFEVVKR